MTNYSMTAPTAGASRGSTPTDYDLWADAVANFADLEPVAKGEELVEQSIATEYITPRYTSTSSNVRVKDRAYFAPIWLAEDMTFDIIGANLLTASGTTALLRLGIVGASATGRPGSLILDAGTVNGATGEPTGNKEIAISQTVSKGQAFLVAVPQGADGQSPSWRCISGIPAQAIHTSAPNWSSNAACWCDATGTVTGALPSSFTLARTDIPPVMYLRRSA